jgi:hypothetical protein
VDPTQSGRSAHGARKSAVFGNFVRSLMLVLLTTSHAAWLPVASAQPVPTNNQLLPPVAMDSAGNFVVVWQSFGKYNIGVQGPALHNQAEPAVAMDSAGNLVVVWLSDGEPRAGHRSIALLGYPAHTSPGREGRVGREVQETSAQPPHVGEFTKSYLPSVPIHPFPSSSWNGGSRLP